LFVVPTRSRSAAGTSRLPQPKTWSDWGPMIHASAFPPPLSCWRRASVSTLDVRSHSTSDRAAPAPFPMESCRVTFVWRSRCQFTLPHPSVLAAGLSCRDSKVRRSLVPTSAPPTLCCAYLVEITIRTENVACEPIFLLSMGRLADEGCLLISSLEGLC